MDITTMGGSDTYAKYLALTSKDYTRVVIKNNPILDYYKIKGSANWGNELFHYCTIDILKSITKEKRLRFSDVRFLNDKTEFKDAIRLLKVVIKNQKKSIDKELYNILADDKIMNGLEDYFQRYPFKKPINNNNDMDSVKPVCRVYTCSFSMSGDLLPMWNYYAHGSKGVSVKFTKLEQCIKTDETIKIIWGKVLYKEEVKQQCIEELLNDIRKLFLLIPDKKCRKDMVQTVVVAAMNNMRIFMKDENYLTEDEYRAVLIVPDEIIKNNQLPKEYDKGHFNRGNIIIPYIDIPFTSKSIRSIIVSSDVMGDFSLIKLGLEDWLSHQNLNGISIHQSNIPMRKY